MRTITINIIFVISVALLIPQGGRVGHADDAIVMPKGVFDFGIEARYWFPIDRRFNPNGKVEDVATDFNATLDSTVFPALAPLDPFVPGLANIGDSVVSFEHDRRTFLPLIMKRFINFKQPRPLFHLLNNSVGRFSLGQSGHSSLILLKKVKQRRVNLHGSMVG